MKKIFLVILTLFLFFGSRNVLATGSNDPGTVGYDISYIQCGGSFPQKPFDFGIVGVNGGRAFYRNPCLADEIKWSIEATGSVSYYMNINAPVGTTAYKGLTGPKGNCKKNNKECIAYNYGYNAAKDALLYASGSGAAASDWWLDVETTNSWSKDKTLNDLTIQAALDYLVSQNLTVGVYSTQNAWYNVAGIFDPVLPYPFRNWVAGAPDKNWAPNFCSSVYSFGGGSVKIVQYPSGGFDGNYACL